MSEKRLILVLLQESSHPAVKLTAATFFAAFLTMMKTCGSQLTKDAAILAKLGLPKLNTYYWRRRTHIMQTPIHQPNMPLAWFGVTRSDPMINVRPEERYTSSEREKVLSLFFFFFLKRYFSRCFVWAYPSRARGKILKGTTLRRRHLLNLLGRPEIHAPTVSQAPVPRPRPSEIDSLPQHRQSNS